MSHTHGFVNVVFGIVKMLSFPQCFIGIVNVPYDVFIPQFGCPDQSHHAIIHSTIGTGL